MRPHRTVVLFILIVVSLLFVPIAQAQDQGQGIDVVIIFDTSGPLLDRFDLLCASMTKNVAALKSRGFDLQVTFLGITNSYACAKDSVSAIKGSTVASDADWGPAVADVAERFPWRLNVVRVIVPMSNRGPGLGDPVDDPGTDRAAIQRAIKAAQASHAIVSPVIGLPDRASRPDDRPRLEVLANDLAKGTGGSVVLLQAATSDPTQDVFGLIAQAAKSATGGPMLALPGAVRTLTCQRDSIKCISLDPGVLLTNAGLAVLFTSILGFAALVLKVSLAEVHAPKLAIPETGKPANLLRKVGGGVSARLSAGADKTRSSIRTVFAPESWAIGTPGIRRVAAIVLGTIFIGLTALLAAFIDPAFNPASPRGLGIFLSIFAAIGLVNLLYARIQIVAAQRQGLSAALRIRPLNLAIILLAALISRSIGFLPGFLIGLPAGCALVTVTENSAAVETRLVTRGLIGVMIVAIFVWLLAIPIDLVMGNLISQSNTDGLAFGLNLLGAVQSVVLTIFVVAVELAFVTLFPLTITGGHHLYERSRLGWGLSFMVVTFIALHTIFNPLSAGFDVFQNSNLLVIGGLLAIITGIALSLWLSAYGERLQTGRPLSNRTFLAVFGVLGAWGMVCACGAIAFAARSVNWGNVLVVLIIVAILAGGGFFAVRMRTQVKDEGGGMKDEATRE